jgi:phenylpropionate dioxygenase-like ring-hydroxylating dioxygenase large terminal subunit
MNTWYAAMWADDLEPGALERRVICEIPVVMYRDLDGNPVALRDRCPHRFAPLSEGMVCDDGSVECPYHGLRFDRTGRCSLNPHGSGRVPEKMRVDSYTLIERHSMLWIWLGDRPADADAIPDFSHLDPGAPGIASKRDWMELDVNYELMVDNLVDLSHASFLHRGLLANLEMVNAEIDIVEEGSQVTVYRANANVPPPQMFDLLYKNDGKNVDLQFNMRWDAPGNLRNEQLCCDPGAVPTSGLRILGSHLVTPIDERRHRYHFCAVRVSEGEPDPSLSETLTKLRRIAFEDQDRPIVEAQQRAFDEAGGLDALSPVMLSIDSGPLRVRRVLSRLIAEEAGEDATADLTS